MFMLETVFNVQGEVNFDSGAFFHLMFMSNVKFIIILKSQQNVQSNLVFSSPLVERICTVKESFRRVEVGLVIIPLMSTSQITEY